VTEITQHITFSALPGGDGAGGRNAEDRGFYVTGSGRQACIRPASTLLDALASTGEKASAKKILIGAPIWP